ncbi:DinB family protein [Jongsikchunia kroppenstedtii]|uniref:DinB family protein n=1 Tax=Jongsikchunia kroppenstedtii TaxID=1121721 RepID=UPI000477A233|nr:DinB family protein [Jongsikchunia kroppenstedtii]
MATWSIPLITTGTERRLLEATLDRNRTELINTVRGLSEEDAHARRLESMTTPIGLLKHAAVAERIWFQHVLGDIPMTECDGPTTAGDASFIVGDRETVADVIAEFERASARSRTIASEFGLDDVRIHAHLGEVSLRFIYLLAIEDFARHAGHGDILREQITAAESPARPQTRRPTRDNRTPG